MAPDLSSRGWSATSAPSRRRDVFAAYRIDEQIAKGAGPQGLLPSGGSLVIDRTEAMTVVDVNTGKFTGSGGNLEETVTKNNLEAAEEIVRQLRLRDIGGIIVVDFIDMVLEPTATWCCAGWWSAWAATAPATRSPRSPRWAWCR